MTRRQASGRDFADRLHGREITELRRHGKFLMADLEGDLVWVTHLGMSGRLGLAREGEPRAAHTNVVVRFQDGREVRFVDPRTFGFVVAYTPDELEESSLADLGPDAWTDLPRSRWLASRLAGRAAPIKALLLDQRLIAGLGNIYADEVLFRARIRPDRPGGDLSFDEVKAVRKAIRPVLGAGLRWGGTSLDDLAYLLPDGRAGEFTSRLRAYGREDEPCVRCGTPMRRTVVRQRSSFWCPVCQR